MNIPGWKTNRKLIVLESDDWGSIRMPSRAIFEELKNSGYNPQNDPYLKYDCLESNEDLERLFEVLLSVKDENGNSAVLTANAVVANPDFDKIKENDFKEYYFEPFTTTLKKYPNHDKVYDFWLSGIKKNIFIPQLHGREHLNIFQWMLSLNNRDEDTVKAFQNNMIGIGSKDNKMKFDFMEGLDFFSHDEKKSKASILREGASLFESLVGYQSKSFIANCYIWDELDEETLYGIGIRNIQGILNQIKPIVEKSGHSHKYIKHFTGQKNKFGQTYTVRNAFFEPSLGENIDWGNECLKRIEIAFRWNKPAIIGCHRLNFIGSIHQDNREKNLDSFSILLKKIVNKWPDVEFVSSDQLTEIMSK